MISKLSIEQVKAQIDIVDVVSDFVSLKKNGQNYKALSPFTNEKTASFYVVPSKGIFKDFSSGKGGDAITFVMEHEGIGYIEAIRYLGKKYGIEMEEAKDTSAQNDRDGIYLMAAFANEFFKSTLRDHEEGKSIGMPYYKERQISAQSVNTFELGYSLNTWHALENEAMSKGYSKEMLLKAGLIVQSDKDPEKYYDRFRGRVIFPIHNLSGKIIGFGARVLGKADGQIKYINSPETEIYHKSDVLYGLYFAKNEIRKQDECFLVEGYTDVISMHQVGIKNVVSSSGTALTQNQIRLIKRFTDNVTIIFDGDNAGISAAIRGIDMVLQEGLKVRVVALPEGADPDSYARKLGSRFREYIISNKKDFVSYKTSLLFKQAANDPIKNAEALKDIINSLLAVSDNIERSMYVKEVATILKIDEGLIFAELNKKTLQSHKYEWAAENMVHQAKDILTEKSSATTLETMVDNQEREIVRSLFNYSDKPVDEEGTTLAEYVVNELDDVEFTVPVYKEILNTYKQSKLEGEIPSLDHFLNHKNEAVKKLASTLTVEKQGVSENWKEKHNIIVAHEKDDILKLAIDNVHMLKLRVIQKMIQDNLGKMGQARNSAEEDHFIDVHKELKSLEMQLAALLNITVSGI